MRLLKCQTFLLVCTALSGCQGLTLAPRGPVEALDLAESLIEAKKYDEVLPVLDYFGVESLALEDKSRWYLLGGTALYEGGEPWQAYDLFRDFIQQHSIPAPALANLTYKIGEALAAANYSFWPFYSSRDEAVQVLSTFVSLYSTYRQQMPDALHRLGEIAYEDGNYELARHRFTQIITNRFDRSVWNTKAAFRVAMCYFRQLEGPEYDLEGMDQAMRELTDFLKPNFENPGFRQEAKAALRTVRSWLGDKHLGIADFYLTLRNRRGEHHHLLIALNQFPETPAAKRAARRLEFLAKTGRIPKKIGSEPR